MKKDGARLGSQPNQMGRTRGQSRRMWREVSWWVLQRGQTSEVMMLRLARSERVGRQSLQASQRKVVMQGRVESFQSHLQLVEVFNECFSSKLRAML